MRDERTATSVSLRRVALVLAAFSAAHDAYFVAVRGSSRGLGHYLGIAALVAQPTEQGGEGEGRVLLAARGLRGGLAQLEQRPSKGSPAVLRVVTSAMQGFDDHDLDLVLTLFSKTLARRQPFVVAWDLRQIAWPRISKVQYSRVREWVGDHVIAWDTYAQAHAIILTHPLARALVALLLRIFRPPQPHRVCKSPTEARDYATTCCKRPRSWVKASYDDRDNRYSLFGAISLRAT